MANKDTVRIVCLAEFRAFEGKSDELVAALHSLIKATTSEAGCLRYELNQSIEDPRNVTFVEKWTNQKAFDEHCQMPYIKHYFDVVRPPLVENFKVTLYQEILP
jgi:quinol monooxygenase YgiN